MAVRLVSLGWLRSGGLTQCARRKAHLHVARGLLMSATCRIPDKVTHTGQKWEDDDYRNVRFIDKEKQVNEQFAINLLAEEPVVLVKGTHTWCDGGKGALGHPKVYINLDREEIADCGYCGKRFLAEQHKKHFQTEKFTQS